MITKGRFYKCTAEHYVTSVDVDSYINSYLYDRNSKSFYSYSPPPNEELLFLYGKIYYCSIDGYLDIPTNAPLKKQIHIDDDKFFEDVTDSIDIKGIESIIAKRKRVGNEIEIIPSSTFSEGKVFYICKLCGITKKSQYYPNRFYLFNYKHAKDYVGSGLSPIEAALSLKRQLRFLLNKNFKKLIEQEVMAVDSIDFW